MNINESIDELRKSGIQILNLITLFTILFSCLVFFNGLEYKYFPNYLKVITIIELIIVFMNLLQFIRFISFDEQFQINKVLLKRYAKFLTFNNILGSYNFVFVFSNVFYFLAAQHYVDLYKYWLLDFVSLIISFSLFTIGMIFMFVHFSFLEKIIKPKVQTLLGLIFMFLAQGIYVMKIIEYIYVPNIADSKFIVLGTTFLVMIAFSISVKCILMYTKFKYSMLEKG
ncbi:DUF5079 family protein [Mammaliicoccus sp. Dog046]|uniref:DUF5079 family protein n=1 Tax=Mammaliicoccus sp. Dog046 TaxID=3034233 RepID=UPI002B25EF8B|nr:DUF5079 family protein [Mammaliicoccus sp. Dog046]WQK85595.1 DUF5079 family protein [Mammaliicoccus sp. Dog046]